MQVTIDMFSGRPNPTWRLPPSRSAELVERCRAMPTRSSTPTDGIARLGFRGIDIVPESPAEMAGRRLVDASTPAVGDDEVDTVRWLLETAEVAVDDDLASALAEEIEVVAARTASSPQTVDSAMDDDLAAALDVDTCSVRATSMRLPYWNTPWVQPFNNCYNYATNFVSGSLAQPGRRSGRPYLGFTCDHVLGAARRDGLDVRCGKDDVVVALGIWPGFDFHWWRLHEGESWAHKVGRWPAQNVDNSYRPLSGGLTPATCDRGPYVQFCGYYFVPMSMWVV